MYEVFDHTADLGLRIRAATREELFADAARAIFSVIVTNLSEVRSVQQRRIRVVGSDNDLLLFDWLNELLFLFETERLILAEFCVEFEKDGLSAECRGESLDPARHVLEHEVKAITYHELKVESNEQGWLAEVIVDI
jgi:SHS2 domain-containing protein